MFFVNVVLFIALICAVSCYMDAKSGKYPNVIFAGLIFFLSLTVAIIETIKL
jgi:hypothetical protein